ncbi:MAG: VUT family protein [Firmicutes bacterium]|nr:VUT family protein [Bacillota bacterium]
MEEKKKVKTSNKNVLKKHSTSSKKTVVEKKEVYEDSWIYILLLSAIVILGQSLKNYTFSLGEFGLTYAIFLLPVMYFLTNYIAKKKGYKKAIMAISISGLSMVIFVAFMNIITGRGFDFYNVAGDFCGYLVSQYVNLTIYQFLLDNTKPNFILIYLNYIFALVVNYLFYSLFYINTIALDTYWVGYFTTLFLQGIMIIALTYTDMQIKRGE